MMNILDTIRNTSIEIIVMALIVFVATMLIKIPIKKKTSTLAENKRKLWNSLIIPIPLLLSFITAIVYGFIFLNYIKIGKMFDLSISTYILSLTIYAIYSRIVVIIQGFKNGNISLDECITQTQEVLLSDTSNVITEEEQELLEVVNQIKILIKEKELLTNSQQVSLATLATTNIKIQSLQEKKKALENLIKNQKEKLQIKGE